MNAVSTETLTVLIVDDSPVVRRRLSALVSEDERLRVVAEAAGALEGLYGFKTHHPDAVVLDLQMPGLNGIELLRRIKLTAPGCVVIVLTNYPPAAVREECARGGADYFLHKSTEFERVTAILGALARTRRPGAPRRGGQDDSTLP